ncbi:MAG: hypothetical protein JO343_00215 [Candidatus Eremiobacteraeota bacterium]|nr:hypothetical protein [Candidatus Eremiobacteraeota bacterium]
MQAGNDIRARLELFKELGLPCSIRLKEAKTDLRIRVNYLTPQDLICQDGQIIKLTEIASVSE